MALKMTTATIADVREMFATSRDTTLARVARQIASDMGDDMQGYTPPFELDTILTDADYSYAQDFQIRQADRARDGEKVQLLTVEGLYRKINEDKDSTNVRAILRHGKLVLVNASAWQGVIDARKAAGEDTSDSENESK